MDRGFAQSYQIHRRSYPHLRRQNHQCRVASKETSTRRMRRKQSRYAAATATTGIVGFSNSISESEWIQVESEKRPDLVYRIFLQKPLQIDE